MQSGKAMEWLNTFFEDDNIDLCEKFAHREK